MTVRGSASRQKNRERRKRRSYKKEMREEAKSKSSRQRLVSINDLIDIT